MAAPVFKNPVIRWIDHRLPVFSYLHHEAYEYPTPKNLFTIDDLGGWSEVNNVFFDPEDSVMASINKDQGFPTEK